MKRTLWLISGIALVLALGCRNKNEERQTGEFGKTVPGTEPRVEQPSVDQPTTDQPATGQPPTDITAERDTYLNSVQQRLDDIDRQIQELRNTAREQANKLEQELTEDRQALNQALTDARQATAENWEETKQKVNDAMGRLQSAYDRASSALKKEGTGSGNTPTTPSE